MPSHIPLGPAQEVDRRLGAGVLIGRTGIRGRSGPSGEETASPGPERRREVGVTAAAKCVRWTVVARQDPQSPRVGSWVGVGCLGQALGKRGSGKGRLPSPFALPPCGLMGHHSAAPLGPRLQPTGAAVGTQDAPLRRLRRSNMAACCAPEVHRASASGTWPAW